MTRDKRKSWEAQMLGWFMTHDAYHKASETYNQRLELVRAERERGNWSINTDAEYKALHDAQSAALRADETFYQALRANNGARADRKYDPDVTVAPCDDAEFGMKP